MTDKIAKNGTKSVAIMVSLKHFSNVWRTLKILLINCEITVILT